MNLPGNTETEVASYRRGKLLTLAVVLVTAVLWLWPLVEAAWTNQLPESHTQISVSDGHEIHKTSPRMNQWINLVINGAVILLVCWYAWRGGSASSGCLIYLYTMALVFCALIGVIALVFFALNVSTGPGFVFEHISLWDFGREWGGTLAFLIFGAWTVFAFWVLVYSADAKFYRDTRRRGVAPGTEPTGIPPLPPLSR